MSEEAEISVVVATRDRADRLEGLLGTLAGQTLAPERFEVIVVDDGSTDRTAELLARARAEGRPRVSVLRRDGNGPAAARNAGWRAASAPLVAFTDDDCEAPPDWLEEALAGAAERPCAIVQGPTTPIPAELERTGPFTRTKEITAPNPSFQTCNIVYPRELLERLEGFDEGFPEALGEDTDLGWRARAAGAEYVFEPEALIHHRVVEMGPVGKLRFALGWSGAMQVLRDHPELRRTLTWRVFWKRSHALLALAVLGAVTARRFPPALLLTLPYLRALRARCLFEGYSLVHMPYLALYDATEMFAAARGAAEHRVLVL